MAATELQVRQPKTARGRRYLRKKGSKVKEDPKNQLVLRGERTNPLLCEALKDLHQLKGPRSRYLPRRMRTRPFEDMTSFEFLCDKNDSTLFAYGSHTKKRPLNVVLGRMFDYKLLDAYEFALDESTFKPMSYFVESSKKSDKSFRYDSKPLLIFQGQDFGSDDVFKGLRNFFVDWLRGVDMRKLNLMGVDHVYVVSGRLLPAAGSSGALMRQLYLRHYKVWYSKSADPKLPCANLEEIGPRMDLTVRRHEHASNEVQKEARRRPLQQNAHRRAPKQKNVRHNEFGERTGKLYVDRRDQDLSKLKYKKIRVLRKMDKDKARAKKKKAAAQQ